MFPRAKYKDDSKSDWASIPDPVATVKYDGASFFLRVEPDGSLRYFSRRPSVKGGFPERTAQVPHLAKTKLPNLAGNVYNVELIHTGKSKSNVESHRAVSGILNSLPDRSVATQAELGPVRAVVHNVIEPSLSTYKDKLLSAKKLQDSFGNPDLLWAAEPHVGLPNVVKLIKSTKSRGQEGVIVTSLTKPEQSNVRVKVKHIDTHNLRVVGIEQEKDKSGQPKNSMGALVCADSTGKVVANVGTGFTRAQREDAWKNKSKWVGRDIQVKSMGLSANRLRMPVFNGDSDGELDRVG